MESEASPIQAFIWLVVAFVAYFLPTFIAARRKHPNGTSIFLLDLFLGWTFIGWLGALIWSASALKGEDIKASPVAGADEKYQALERLAALKDKGAITEQEFQAEKAKLLG